MTCIAWDGKTLAADKRATSGSVVRAVTKVFRLRDGSLAGFAGDSDYCVAMRAWLDRQDATPANFPDFQKTDDYAAVMVITPQGRIQGYHRTPYPMHFEDSFFAIGSGREYAIAAMYLGRTARQAVELACHLDPYCGNGIDTLELEP